ncbi:CNH domain-domain-containing protein [Protomyces lactucae-debilis]|uniref:CNH domain-domain-containing protein n=1 Tax=Protomyces lactucae-debilis TaxID=2754530 RepID=A0A1Y2F0D6_PROLT|nr:CNH domain-containing protein [Protomyces lactucae-debilis]ORY77361.1 CNH domain-domain-containing protein [Protomyces lactucae-debilis]
MSSYPQRPPKPSSYSPTFLARQASYETDGRRDGVYIDSDAFRLDAPAAHGAYMHANDYDTHAYEPDEGFTQQASHGTRPLPCPPPLLSMPESPMSYTLHDEAPATRRRRSSASQHRLSSAGYAPPHPLTRDLSFESQPWQPQESSRRMYESLYQQPLEEPYPVDMYDAYEAQVDQRGTGVQQGYGDPVQMHRESTYASLESPYSPQSARPLPTPLSRGNANDAGAYSYTSDDSITAWDAVSAYHQEPEHHRRSTTSISSGGYKTLPPVPSSSYALAHSPPKSGYFQRSGSLPALTTQSGHAKQASLNHFLEESAETLRAMPGRPLPSPQRSPLPPVDEHFAKSRQSATFPRIHGDDHRRSGSVVTLDQLGARLDRRPTRTQSPQPAAVSMTQQVLSSADYDCCSHVWSRSNVFLWLYTTLQDPTSANISVALVGLFTHHVPTLSIIQAEKVAQSLLDSLFSAGELVQIERGAETLRFATDVGDGVLPLLTGHGCYAPYCQDGPYRCYASRCSRTPARHTQQSAVVNREDWAAFWGLSGDSELLKTLSKDEIQRQYQIHEVVYSERDYIETLKVLTDVYSDSFVAGHVGQQEVGNLLFGLVPRLLMLSEQHLEPALRARQSEQGPCVQNLGDLFISWIELAKDTYLQYAANLRHADRAVRSRKARDPATQRWLAQCEQDPRTKKLDLFSYMGAPTRRLQRYALLLSDVLKKTPQDDREYGMLGRAISAVQEVCHACNSCVERAENKIMLMDLHEQIVWRVPKRDLGLLETGRAMLRREHLQRKSESHLEWQTRELVLLDHYMLCLKSSRDGPGRVLSRPPIPIDYLVVEDYDEIIYKASTSKILGGTMTHSIASPMDASGRRFTHDSSFSLSTTESAKSPSELSHTLTVTSTNSPGISRDNSKMLFPFTVKHAGRWEKHDGDEKWTLYAETAGARAAWVEAIRKAKQDRFQKYKHAEPFRIQLCATEAFGSYNPEGLGLTSAGVADARPSPAALRPPENTLELALQQAPAVQLNTQPLTFARVQCATMFRGSAGEDMLMLGTDDGLYHAVIHGAAASVWTKVASFPRVTQVAVLEQFGCAMVLADKSLTAYQLDDLLYPQPGQKKKRVPQKLSGSKDVGFFEVGIMKDRLLVVYKKRDNGTSVFKALEPVVGRKQENRSLFRKSTHSGSGTDFFRDFDQFFIPADCYGMQYLRSTICVRCSRGFEILSLDSKQPMTIPDLTSPATASLKARIDGARPLGTYRLASSPPDAQGNPVEGEFLCCYTACALFVDKYGQLSRAYTLEWEGRPQHAVLLGNYIVAAGPSFVEVWNVEKRRLRQVITGKDVRILPYSSAGGGLTGSGSEDVASRGVMLAMAHPFKAGRQVVLELRLR